MIGLVAMVTTATVFVWNTGFVRPKIRLVSASASAVQASSTTRPALTFVVRNEGSVPLYIEGVDARASGLEPDTISIANYGLRGPAAHPLHGSVRIGGGGEVLVAMTFTCWGNR